MVEEVVVGVEECWVFGGGGVEGECYSRKGVDGGGFGVEVFGVVVGDDEGLEVAAGAEVGECLEVVFDVFGGDPAVGFIEDEEAALRGVEGSDDTQCGGDDVVDGAAVGVKRGLAIAFKDEVVELVFGVGGGFRGFVEEDDAHGGVDDILNATRQEGLELVFTGFGGYFEGLSGCGEGEGVDSFLEGELFDGELEGVE